MSGSLIVRLFVLAGALVLAGSSIASGPPEVAAASGLRVVVSCYSNPEKVKVTNRSARSITIGRVGSLYQPNSGEPYAKTRPLAAGKSITFYSGPGASSTNSNTLTRASIFNNDVGSTEGARVTTSTGTKYTDRCG